MTTREALKIMASIRDTFLGYWLAWFAFRYFIPALGKNVSKFFFSPVSGTSFIIATCIICVVIYAIEQHLKAKGRNETFSGGAANMLADYIWEILSTVAPDNDNKQSLQRGSFYVTFKRDTSKTLDICMQHDNSDITVAYHIVCDKYNLIVVVKSFILLNATILEKDDIFS
jgi:hypothetical protein